MREFEQRYKMMTTMVKLLLAYNARNSTKSLIYELLKHPNERNRKRGDDIAIHMELSFGNTGLDFSEALLFFRCSSIKCTCHTNLGCSAMEQEGSDIFLFH